MGANLCWAEFSGSAFGLLPSYSAGPLRPLPGVPRAESTAALAVYTALYTVVPPGALDSLPNPMHCAL